MKIVIVTQARVGSTRLPEKVLKKVDDKHTLLSLHLERLKKSKLASSIVVATTNEKGAEKIISIAKEASIKSYQGSVDDVLDRFYQAVVPENPDYVVRVTSDCPLIDAELLDRTINKAITEQLDYLMLDENFPDGIDIEVISFNSLKKAWEKAKLPSEREHVTPYVRNNSTIKGKKLFKGGIYPSEGHYNNFRITVDESTDLDAIKWLITKLGTEEPWKTYIQYIQDNPKEFKNQTIIRNEGLKKSLKKELEMGTGQELYKKAKKLIPGGTMLLSKRPEMFLPDLWPAYYSKTQGCRVWDLDNKEYIDMSLMGVGTNTLGYNHPEVDAAVIDTVRKGNMSTLNCPEEVYLAEKLIEINPWADMVRFGRSGGEINAVAIRIARAAAGKDNVAVCGYHGWHDWYISMNHNSSEDNLGKHLLSGLSPNGVPKNLKNSVYPFMYNDFEELKQLVETKDIGVIKMEVTRNMGPKDNFLQKVRDLATQKGIILIFDECSSGFRETYGGLFKKYGVEPDMAVFGKTIANGYALTAVVGKREIMEAAQTTFISSTFWTERIGPSAALKALEVIERERSWERITAIGNQVREGWQKLAKAHNLEISLAGIPALSTYSFVSPNAQKYKTYITQEMLQKGFLASTNFYPCIAHTDAEIDSYFNALDDVYKEIALCEKGERNIDNLLLGPVSHSGFSRLN